MIAYLIPTVFLFFALWLRVATGPYWQFPDPAYGYLTSSLSLFQGFSPTFNYQPGTTLQILGALIIFVAHIGHSTLEAVHHVLLNPDFYLGLINTVLLVFVATTALFLGQYVYRQTKDKTACLLVQLPLLIFLSLKSYSFYDIVLPVVTNVSPEPLLITIALLFNWGVLQLFFSKDKTPELGIIAALAFIGAAGIATRLTFAPVLLLPLILARGVLKFVFILFAVLAVVFWTLPILPAYGWIGHWVLMLLTHTGEYGSGTAGFIHGAQFLANLQMMAGRYGLMIFPLGWGVVFGIIQIMRRRAQKAVFFMLATALSMVVTFVLIAKHYDEHYCVVPLGLLGLLFVLMYLSVPSKGWMAKIMVWGYMAIFVFQSLGGAVTYYQQLSKHTTEAVRFNQMIHARYDGFTFIGMFPMPMLNSEPAFFWGNDRDARQSDELSRMYPKNLAYFDNNTNDYAPYVSGIYAIKERVWADDLIASKTRVAFVAPNAFDFSKTPYAVISLEHGRDATLYWLVGSTEKQAEMLFNASIRLLNQAQYAQALICALKSKEAHYQPLGKINYLLALILSRS